MASDSDLDNRTALDEVCNRAAVHAASRAATARAMRRPILVLPAQKILCTRHAQMLAATIVTISPLT
jgi:hypothetical protein